MLPGVSSPAETGLFVLARLHTIYFARPGLLPLTVGLILAFLFRPVVRGLKRWRIPEPARAALVVLAVIGGCGLASMSSGGPASDWLAKAPRSPAPWSRHGCRRCCGRARR